MTTKKAELQDERAGTVELDATVNGKEMFAYMVPGCCSLRSYCGFNKGTPAEVIEGIVNSGIGGSVMVLTDAYSKGKHAKAFKQFVEENKLGTATLSPPIRNPYTGNSITAVIFGYALYELVDWVNKKLASEGKTEGWARPKRFKNGYEAVNMDRVFYQLGGRPKPKSGVDVKYLVEATQKDEQE